MSRIAIVSTQMQLINCVELLYKTSKRIDLLIVLCHSGSRRRQLIKMLGIQEILDFFKDIRYITLHKTGVKALTSQFYCKRQLKTIAKQYSIEECVLGNNFPIQNRYFIYRVNQYNSGCIFYVCDDGLASLASFDSRNIQLTARRNTYPVNSKVLEFIYLFSGVNMFIPRRFIYFTIFNLADNNVDVITHNSYSFLRSHYNLFDYGFNSNVYDVVILGQPLLDQNIVNKGEFNRYIRFIINSSSTKKVLYISHPQESIDNSVFDADIKSRIDVVKMDYPIETLISILESKTVYSFYTSALVTLKYMSPEMRLYALWLQEVSNKHNEYSERVERVYSYLSSHGIQVIHVNS